MFQFYKFPEPIRCSIYTTNLIERNNIVIRYIQGCFGVHIFKKE